VIKLMAMARRTKKSHNISWRIRYEIVVNFIFQRYVFYNLEVILEFVLTFTVELYIEVHGK